MDVDRPCPSQIHLDIICYRSIFCIYCGYVTSIHRQLELRKYALSMTNSSKQNTLKIVYMHLDGELYSLRSSTPLPLGASVPFQHCTKFSFSDTAGLPGKDRPNVSFVFGAISCSSPVFSAERRKTISC